MFKDLHKAEVSQKLDKEISFDIDWYIKAVLNGKGKKNIDAICPEKNNNKKDYKPINFD